MTKEKETASKGTNSSVTPMIIIGLIFLATIAGIWWISQSGDSSETANENTKNTNTAAQTQQVANNYAKAPAGASPEWFKGSPNAAVVLEEFADFQCGACADKHSVFNEINSIYGSKVKFVFRNYPLVQAHPKAYDAAVAVEAAGLQGKFWEMQNLLFANQQRWSTETNHRDTFKGYAKTIGLDVDKFTTDSLGLMAKNRVDSDMRRGNALALRSTPSLFINGKSVPFEQMSVVGLKSAIDAELKRVSPEKEAPETDKESAGNENTASESKDEKPADKEAKPEENE
jgi:protein-disulfide isomerase